MIVWILVGLGVAVELVAVLGVAVMREAIDRLHYVGMAGYGALLVAIGIFVRRGPSLIGDKSLLTGVLLVLLGPVVAHVTARSMAVTRRRREQPEDRTA